uniref:Cytochrome P450 n=1 Tax=Clytia hemisphaerica TaxID=252671 RepID=A0A7M5WQK8_9CNID
MIPMILEWITYLLLAVVVYNLIVYLNHVYHLKDYPPGPFPLPLIGNLHCIDFKRPHKTYQKLTKVYGDVFSISFGMERIVMVNTIEQAKEALVTKSAEFAGRPSNHHAFAMITRNYQDLVFADYGSHWLMLRKLAIRSLKMYANLDGKLEVKVAQEVEQMNGRLMEKINEPVNLNVEIRLFMTNIISTIVLGERYENIENPTFQKILELNNYLHYAVYHGDPISISKSPRE